MITSSKCRPRNNAGRFFVTALPYQIAGSAFATDPCVKGAAGGVQVLQGDVEVAGGGADVGVAQQNLNGTEIGSGVQHVGGAGVAAMPHAA